MRVSVIVPVKDGANYLRRTLPALIATLPEGAELIVSDDGSRDESAKVAGEAGAQVVVHGAASGPAAARNRGAARAQGELLVFLDADVRVHPDSLAQLVAAFDDAGVAAAFGSYDNAPESRSWISLYKNLAHHFVHQRSSPEASTFWAGWGAIRAGVFRDCGGFDESYVRPSIEDVELGCRLRSRGCRIRLVRQAQVQHLKRWTLASWLTSDFRDRAIPWARLLRSGAGLPLDLNFTTRDRAATALVGLGLAAAPLALLDTRALAVGGSAWGLALLLDADFMGFAARQVSLRFGLAAGLLHLVHRVAGLAGFLVGLLMSVASRRAAP
jgi:GT2 family glycosyltransferase